MLSLTLAAVVLLATHIGLSSSRLRPLLVLRLGERGFLVLYSAISIVAVLWLVMAYNRAPYTPLWPRLEVLRWLAILVMPAAFLLLTAGIFGPNPTAVGQARLLEEPLPVRGMLRVTRHPMMWGIGLWGILHLLARGDLASILFFGAFAALALLGALAIDVKHRARGLESWRRFQEASSNLPFAAILAGRQTLAPKEIGLFPVILAIVLYLATLLGHPWLFGVAAIG
jgi:uncharacterized membrane protein